MSSSHSASQAKKRKKNRREDPIKRQQARERTGLDKTATRLSNSSGPRGRQDSEQRRREHDAETHQSARLDLQEQERNTVAHRQLCLEDSERRQEEQERHTSSPSTNSTRESGKKTRRARMRYNNSSNVP